MAKRCAYLGVLVALGLILSHLEGLLPPFIPIPGVKIGLANCLTVIILYQMNGKWAFTYILLRVGLAGLLFANLPMFLISLAGGITSGLLMCIAKGLQLKHPMVVSALGGVAHNLGQLFMAYLVVQESHIFTLWPWFVLLGTGFGLLMGWFSHILMKKMPRLGE